jgi:hypothetical protein
LHFVTGTVLYESIVALVFDIGIAENLVSNDTNASLIDLVAYIVARAVVLSTVCGIRILAVTTTHATASAVVHFNDVA